MVNIVSNIFYPHEAGSKVAKKYLEMFKKYPPNPEISKQLALCTRGTEKGIEVLAVSEVKKGKVQEAMMRLATQFQEYATLIGGFKWQVNVYLNMSEAFKSIGLEAPE